MTDAAPNPGPIPAISMLTNDASVLLNAIADRHGGPEALGVDGMEICLAMTKAYGDARRAATPLERIRALELVPRLDALLPQAPKAEASYLDVSLLASDELDELHALLAKATVVGEPDLDVEEQARLSELKALRDEVMEARHLQAQLADAVRERDGHRSESARLAGELHLLQQELARLSAGGAPGVRLLPPPGRSMEVLPPARSGGAPRAPRPEPLAPLAPGQGDGFMGGVMTAPPAYERFSAGGRGE